MSSLRPRFVWPVLHAAWGSFALEIEGLSDMRKLEELWLCRNRITGVGDGLPPGSALRDVNLAHNRVGCFKELLKLSSLEGLRSLTLQDLHFGDNPVCTLSNYKTYVAYHVPQVIVCRMALRYFASHRMLYLRRGGKFLFLDAIFLSSAF